MTALALTIRALEVAALLQGARLLWLYSRKRPTKRPTAPLAWTLSRASSPRYRLPKYRRGCAAWEAVFALACLCLAAWATLAAWIIADELTR
jgi:hypothetical protein